MIIQWIILGAWIWFVTMDDEEENLPTFWQALTMIVCPLALVVLLLMYLYRNDKLRDKN